MTKRPEVTTRDETRRNAASMAMRSGPHRSDITGHPTYAATSHGTTSSPRPANDLPHGIGALQTRWRELPPTLTPDQVLKAEWLALSRAPLYRALASGSIASVKCGRRTLILTVPLLRMMGIEIDRPPNVHDVDDDEAS